VYLATGALEIPGEREDAAEEPSRRPIGRVLAAVSAADGHGLLRAMETDQPPGTLDGRLAGAGPEHEEHRRRPLPHDRPGSTPRLNITTIGVLGAGQMGSGIAQVAAGAGYQVILVDASPDIAEKGKAKVMAILAKVVEKGKMKAE